MRVTSFFATRHTHSKTSPVSTVITYSCSPDYRRGRHYYTEDGKSSLRCFFEELTTGLEFFLFALFHDRSIIPYRLPGFRFGYKKKSVRVCISYSSRLQRLWHVPIQVERATRSLTLYDRPCWRRYTPTPGMKVIIPERRLSLSHP